MKFTAQKIDLVLELVTLTGGEEVLSPKASPTAEEILNTMDVWKSIEKEKKGNNIGILADQLAIVYPKTSDWFLQNFDVKTLSDIVVYVASSMGGVRKNAESSN